MSKAVIQPFEDYHKGRVMFVQTVSKLANIKNHIDSLRSVGVMKLLGPLLSDPVPPIKHCAALTIGRLARNSIDLAKAVVEDNGRIIKQLLNPNNKDNKFYKQASCFVISSVARHSSDLAKKVTQFNAIKYLVECLEEYDPLVKKSAVWALGYIAQHSDELAKLVTNEPNAIDYLILCLQEPEIKIKSITVQTLSHIAKHSPERTESVNSKENLAFIMFYLKEKDTTLKHKICTCLANMARNSLIVAQKIVSELQTSIIFECIKSQDFQLQKSSINLLNEIAIRESDLAVTVNSKIEAKEIVNFLRQNKGPARLFTLPLVSTITGHGKDLADAYLNAGVLDPLYNCLTYEVIYDSEKEGKEKEKDRDKEKEVEVEIKSLACKAIASIANHNAETSNKICDYGEIPYNLLCIICFTEFSKKFENLKRNARVALESIIRFTEKIVKLETLLNAPIMPEFLSNLFSTNSVKNNKIALEVKPSFDRTAYEEILIQAIRRMQDILMKKELKADFLKRKTLQTILRLQKQYPSIKEEIPAFHSIFSQDIVNFYDEEHALQQRKRFLDQN